MPREIPESPGWVTALGTAGDAEQLFVVAGCGGSGAWISMHEKDQDGCYRMILSVPGFIGREGLGKTAEGDGKTPVGVFHFNKAFGVADDPGCAIPYVKVDDDIYWSSDDHANYNQMVRLGFFPDLRVDLCEHIAEYVREYRYCLNISYNEEGVAGAGSAIFLHCFGDRKPCTDGCVAIPREQMAFVMRRVSPGCVVIIGSMKDLGAEF